MVTLSALHDWNAPLSNYFMLDAAVAIEAIDGGAIPIAHMTHSTWVEPENYANRLYASYWWTLFPTNDGRSTLTWSNPTHQTTRSIRPPWALAVSPIFAGALAVYFAVLFVSDLPSSSSAVIPNILVLPIFFLVGFVVFFFRSTFPLDIDIARRAVLPCSNAPHAGERIPVFEGVAHC